MNVFPVRATLPLMGWTGTTDTEPDGTSINQLAQNGHIGGLARTGVEVVDISV